MDLSNKTSKVHHDDDNKENACVSFCNRIHGLWVAMIILNVCQQDLRWWRIDLGYLVTECHTCWTLQKRPLFILASSSWKMRISEVQDYVCNAAFITPSCRCGFRSFYIDLEGGNQNYFHFFRDWYWHQKEIEDRLFNLCETMAPPPLLSQHHVRSITRLRDQIQNIPTSLHSETAKWTFTRFIYPMTFLWIFWKATWT